MFAGQFGLLFLGMHLGVTAGLASLVLQAQVFITIALAALALKEPLSAPQLAGAFIAAAGLVVVATHTGGDVSLAGLLCLLLAAASWGAGNLVSKRMGRVNSLGLVAWGGLVVPLPMLAASLAFEGPAMIWHSLTHLSRHGILSVAFIVYVSTGVGFSLWNWLLARHPAASVAPFALFVPVAGLLSSALVLGESIPSWKLVAAILVLGGLAINVFGPRFLTPKPTASA